METIDRISEYRGYVLAEESTLLGEVIQVRIYDKATRDLVTIAPSRVTAIFWIEMAISAADKVIDSIL